ncbi:MAG: hypothetical protein GXY44_16390 [Phycisphaerales bacterium]|nr:hypothetical protein [Phycisphaerales bacterium]
MIRFNLARNNHDPSEIDLSGSYLIGSEGVPLLAEVVLRESQLICNKRADGPAGIALLWDIHSCGSVMLETSRLMDREAAYHLPLELTRGRLMHIFQKREDWGLFDLEGSDTLDKLNAEVDNARDLFVEALKADTIAHLTQISEKALKGAFVVGEKLSQFHAELLLAKRKQIHAFHRRTIGVSADVANVSDKYRQLLGEHFDFVYLPMPWRLLEPSPRELNWSLFDGWIEWLTANRIPIKVGPLLSLSMAHMPDWLIAVGDDFEQVLKLTFEHLRRVIDRYSPYVLQWDVLSGIHAENPFNYSFEQIMELTRTTVSLVKQLAPQSQTVVDLTAPWGEYFARNPRTIPPMLYADMVVQSGVGFDALGAQFVFGAPADGMYVRDMFQISERLDRLGNFGKPVHLTAVQVPSSQEGEGVKAGGGAWWKPWSEAVQAKWLKEFYTLALSKPFIESVTWRDLVDRPQPGPITAGGLFNGHMRPKPAFKILQDIRGEVLSAIRKPPARSVPERK